MMNALTLIVKLHASAHGYPAGSFPGNLPLCIRLPACFVEHKDRIPQAHLDFMPELADLIVHGNLTAVVPGVGDVATA